MENQIEEQQTVQTVNQKTERNLRHGETQPYIGTKTYIYTHPLGMVHVAKAPGGEINIKTIAGGKMHSVMIAEKLTDRQLSGACLQLLKDAGQQEPSATKSQVVKTREDFTLKVDRTFKAADGYLLISPALDMIYERICQFSAQLTIDEEFDLCCTVFALAAELVAASGGTLSEEVINEVRNK